MSQSAALQAFYEDYYNDDVAKKRTITAVQSVDHLLQLGGPDLGATLDVGAGDGAVLQEIDRRRIVKSLDALEISASGIARIKARNIPTLRSVQTFDGYKIPHLDQSFDTAIAIHVLEHVEHERLFLQELARVAKQVYVEIPLEHTLRLKRSISLGRPFGHINHYTFDRFLNLLETSGLTPVKTAVFSNSSTYEQFVGGRIKGAIKHAIRSSALKTAPAIAPMAFVYLGAALCSAN
jgi:ubiquinone/menaquinone biosynthesis C-methylase UbiE